MKNKNVNLTIKTKWAFKWYKIIKNNWYKYSNYYEIPHVKLQLKEMFTYDFKS